LTDLGFELRANLARGHIAILGAGTLDPLIHRRVNALFRIGDARLGGLLGLLVNRDFRRADRFFMLGRRDVEQLLNEWSYGLIESGSNAIFERHVMFSTRAGQLGTQAAAGVRASVRL